MQHHAPSTTHEPWAARIFTGKGRLARRCREQDWSATVLGAIDTWPAALRTLAAMALLSPAPMLLLWGPELALICNDGFAAQPGAALPDGPGQPARQAWPGAAGLLDHMAERVLRRGEALAIGPGHPAFTAWPAPDAVLNCSPAVDEHGAIRGMLVMVTPAALPQSAPPAVTAEARQMLDAMPLIVWVTDGAGGVEFFNQRWRDYTGLELDPDNAAAVAAAVLHPDDAAITMERFGQAMESGTLFLVEHRIRARDGTYRWFLVKGVPLRDPATGAVIRWLGVSTDIDGIKREEQSRHAFAARQSFQLALADCIRPLADPEEVMASACELLGRLLGASRVTYGEMEQDGEVIALAGGWTDGSVRSLAGLHLTLDEFGPAIGAALRAGDIMVTEDVATDEQLAPYRERYANAEIGAYMAIPLMKHGRLQAILSVHDRGAHAWTGNDVDMARDMVDRTWAAVDSARAQQAARENARRLQALNAGLERRITEQLLARGRTWQVSPDILAVLDGQGFFEAVNPAWEASLGWSAEELASTIFLEFVHPDDRARTLEAWQDTLLHNTPVLRFDNRYLHKAGGVRWLSWVAVPDEGKLYCSARDVTREKRAQAELVTRTGERDRMWNTSPDLMLLIDSDGWLRRVNPAWMRVLGYAAEELVGHHVTEFALVDDHADTVAAYANAARSSSPQLVDRYRHKDGSVRWIAWVAAPFGGMTYATGRDITLERERQAALEQAQEQLRQAQKMEAVGQLTGGLAHDFNNMLASIMGGLELSAIRIRQDRPDEVQRYMGMAMSATRRAAALTHRLLAFSRRQTLAPIATDVNALVNGMLDIIRRTVGPAIQVDAAPATALWPALVDPSQLENSLLNLCLNARDAMPDGGRIVVGTANRHVEGAEAAARGIEAGDYLALCVADTGTGMTPDVMAKAFEPFFTTKPLGQGTGLGLSMIYGFAHQSGGHVGIDSEPGKGTQVCMLLPRHHGAAAPVADAGASALPPAAASGRTVLVVDDEPDVRQLVTDVLREQGHIAIEAADGPAALRVLQSNARIDLLVSDVGLPGAMNGRQVADAARTHRPGLKVLFITGYAEAALLTNGQLEAGMAVLSKPFPLEALAGKVREMVA
jgi:PAS domain S-box-containing protein